MGLAGDIIQMNVGQRLQSPFIPRIDLTGQIIVITGANTGLGFETAKHLYKLNTSTLILACRNETKGEAARKAVIASNPSSKGKVDVWSLDMASFASVLAFGDRLKSLTRLDAFISNAGIDTVHFERFEGHESTITLESPWKTGKLDYNGIGDAYLRKVPALDHLMSPGPGKIFSTLDDEKTADMDARYYLSKLMVTLGVHQLARKVDDGNDQGQGEVIVNYVNPGWCKTELFRSNDRGKIVLALIGRSAEDGGKTLVYGAVAGRETHGKYLDVCRIKEEGTWVRGSESIETEKRMWVELVDILEKIRPGVTRL